MSADTHTHTRHRKCMVTRTLINYKLGAFTYAPVTRLSSPPTRLAHLSRYQVKYNTVDEVHKFTACCGNWWFRIESSHLRVFDGVSSTADHDSISFRSKYKAFKPPIRLCRHNFNDSSTLTRHKQRRNCTTVQRWTLSDLRHQFQSCPFPSIKDTYATDRPLADDSEWNCNGNTHCPAAELLTPPPMKPFLRTHMNTRHMSTDHQTWENRLTLLQSCCSGR